VFPLVEVPQAEEKAADGEETRMTGIGDLAVPPDFLFQPSEVHMGAHWMIRPGRIPSNSRLLPKGMPGWCEGSSAPHRSFPGPGVRDVPLRRISPLVQGCNPVGGQEKR